MLLMKGGRLPFADNAFDAVVSIDTAEYVPREARRQWIQDFFRVAGRQVIICAPLGTVYQSGVDIEMNELFKRLFGYEHHYLREHVACTMPDISEIKEWVGDQKYKLHFSGDARIYRKQFITLFNLQKRGGPLKTPLKLMHQLFTLTDLKPLKLADEPGPYTRRWYLSVEV
jgi:ubiquinone/menaquinone biosynthesis C-methylase UbiE